MDNSIAKKAEEQANYCRIFSNSYRIMIAWVLFERELSVSEVAEEIQATLQNTSQHLRLMKDNGFVESRRDGQIVYYSIAKHVLLEKCPVLLQASQVLSSKSNKEKKNV